MANRVNMYHILAQNMRISLFSNFFKKILIINTFHFNIIFIISFSLIIKNFNYIIINRLDSVSAMHGFIKISDILL